MTILQLEAEIERSVQNVINLSLFNEVKGHIIALEGMEVMVMITVAERFYTYPVPIFKFEEPNFSTWWKDKNFDRTSYGLALTRKNFRGRNEELEVKAQLGFTKRIGFSYFIPYISKGQKLGMYFGASYNQNDDVPYATRDNERLFFTEQNGKSRVEKQASVGFTYRKAIYSKHEVNLTYRNILISDSLSRLNPEFLLEEATEDTNLSLFYRWINSKTNNDNYPLVGFQTELKLTKFGLGIISDKTNVLTVRPRVTKFWQLGEKLWFHSGLSLKYSLYKDLPYRIQQGLGFGDTFVRGYEFYVVDGQHYGLLRSNIKTTLLAPRTIKVPFFNIQKLQYIPIAVYINGYTDIGYVQDKLTESTNPLSNTLLRGSGVGIDFVTAYDRIFRLEFSVNDLSETGFYISYRRSI